MRARVAAVLGCLFFFIICQIVEAETVKRYTVQILKTLPHSTESFTQGLLYHEGVLYESTGLYGHSTLQKLDAKTGQVLKKIPVAQVFAEGLALWQDRLIQLTWKSRRAFIYTLEDFSLLGEFQYATEGWGLTHDGYSLIMSDGTHRLTFRDPETFEIERNIDVTVQGEPLPYLNELEYIDGLIYANVWYQQFIVQIDPVQGEVVGVIDARPLFRQLPPLSDESVLNGIAYNDRRNTLYLTGKKWPKIFEVILQPVQSSDSKGG